MVKSVKDSRKLRNNGIKETKVIEIQDQSESELSSSESEYQIIKDKNYFEVDKVIDKRLNQNVTEYLIKWKHYGNKWNTWEPIDNLQNIEDMINEFDNEQIYFTPKYEFRSKTNIIKNIEKYKIAEMLGFEIDFQKRVFERIIGKRRQSQKNYLINIISK